MERLENIFDDINALHRNGCIGELFTRLLKAKEIIAALKTAIKNVPTNEYGRAQQEGCDSCGAWDCFLEELDIWQKQALKNNP